MWKGRELNIFMIISAFYTVLSLWYSITSAFRSLMLLIHLLPDTGRKWLWYKWERGIKLPITLQSRRKALPSEAQSALKVKPIASPLAYVLSFLLEFISLQSEHEMWESCFYIKHSIQPANLIFLHFGNKQTNIQTDSELPASFLHRDVVVVFMVSLWNGSGYNTSFFLRGAVVIANIKGLTLTNNCFNQRLENKTKCQVNQVLFIYQGHIYAICFFLVQFVQGNGEFLVKNQWFNLAL